MRIRMQPSRRGGFTLIELLVVVSILALLIGLTMAGIGRVRAVQHVQTTESTVKKLQVGLNQQLTATFDEATKAGNPYAEILRTSLCDGDMDRAKSLLCYAQSKRGFPMNFVEAKTPIAGIPADTAFATLTLPTGLTLDQQAATILYIIVHDKSGRGTSIDADAALASAEMIIKDPNNGKEYKAFKDAYGTPIAFLRWYGANPATVDYSRIQNAPFANPKDPNKDPFDRTSKLQNPWPTSGNRLASRTALNLNATIPIDFDGLNKVITVISAGPDKKFGPIFGGSPADANDDVFGYPLAQFGARGN